MRYLIPDLPEEDYKIAKDIVLNPDNDVIRIEVKTYTLPSGKKLNITYTTTRTNVEVVDDEDEWVHGSLYDLPTKDYEYIKENILFQPDVPNLYEVVLPSGRKVRISADVEWRDLVK